MSLICDMNSMNSSFKLSLLTDNFLFSFIAENKKLFKATKIFRFIENN